MVLLSFSSPTSIHLQIQPALFSVCNQGLAASQPPSPTLIKPHRLSLVLLLLTLLICIVLFSIQQPEEHFYSVNQVIALLCRKPSLAAIALSQGSFLGFQSHTRRAPRPVLTSPPATSASSSASATLSQLTAFALAVSF